MFFVSRSCSSRSCSSFQRSRGQGGRRGPHRHTAGGVTVPAAAAMNEGEAHGRLGVDHVWRRQLQSAIDATELPGSLDDALRPLAAVASCASRSRSSSRSRDRCLGRRGHLWCSARAWGREGGGSRYADKLPSTRRNAPPAGIRCKDPCHVTTCDVTSDTKSGGKNSLKSSKTKRKTNHESSSERCEPQLASTWRQALAVRCQLLGFSLATQRTTICPSCRPLRRAPWGRSNTSQQHRPARTNGCSASKPQTGRHG